MAFINSLVSALLNFQSIFFISSFWLQISQSICIDNKFYYRLKRILDLNLQKKFYLKWSQTIFDFFLSQLTLEFFPKFLCIMMWVQNGRNYSFFWVNTLKSYGKIINCMPNLQRLKPINKRIFELANRYNLLDPQEEISKISVLSFIANKPDSFDLNHNILEKLQTFEMPEIK